MRSSSAGLGFEFVLLRARRWTAIVLLGSALAGAVEPASAQAAPDTPPPQTSPAPAGTSPVVPAIPPNPAEPAPLYAAPTRADRTGRIMAAVEVNGQGPYRFILDTGANRSAVSSRLVAELGLPASALGSIDLHGVTGYARLPSVDVTVLQAGEFSYDPGPLPVLANLVFADADGILGMEGFVDSRIEVDFAEDRVSIEKSSGKRPGPGYYRVPASNYRGLLLVEGRAGRIPVKAIVDTGAEHTLGNAALHDVLVSRVRRDQRHESRVVGATDATYVGTSFLVPNLRIGAARLNNLPVTFGDMHVFEVWGLTDEPALLIGMDVIGTLRRFAVDYKRWEIQLMPFGPARSQVRRCGPTECRSRIPERDPG